MTDEYDNLVLLCSIHHKQVDDQRGTYTVGVLHSIKNAHESWVQVSLEGAITAQQRYFTLPPTHRKNPYFVAVADVAATLQSLRAGDNLILYGPPGAGKTQHAVQHAHEQRDRYGTVLWASAESVPTLIQALLTLADLTLSPRERQHAEHAKLAAFRAWLSVVPRWLLILDNADHPDVVSYINELVPSSHQGTVLITSQTTSWTPGLCAQRVDTWSAAEGLRFLQQRLRRHATDTEEFAALTHDVGGLPLALEHAAAYIAETEITVRGYRDLLQRERRHLFSRHHTGMTHYQRSIAATWQVSVSRIGWLAQNILHYASGLGAEAIPRSILSHLIASSSIDPTYSSSERQQLQREVTAPDALNVALAELSRYSLVWLSKETLRLHPSLQQVLLDAATLRPWQLRYWRCRLWGISGATPSLGAGMWLFRTAHLLNQKGVLPVDLENESATLAMRPFLGHLEALARKTAEIGPRISAWEGGARFDGIMPLKRLFEWYQERITWYSTGSALLCGILKDNAERSPHLRPETTWFLDHFEELYRQATAKKSFGGIPATILCWLATDVRSDVRGELYHFLNVLAREHAESGSVENAARLFHFYYAHATADPKAPPREAALARLHEALSLRAYLPLHDRQAKLNEALDWYAQHDPHASYDTLSVYRGIWQYAQLADNNECRDKATDWIRRVLPKARGYLAYGCDHACGLTEAYIALGDAAAEEKLRLCEETLRAAVRSRKLARASTSSLWEQRGHLLRAHARPLHAARSYARGLALELRHEQPTRTRQFELHFIAGAMYYQASARTAARRHLVRAHELLEEHAGDDASHAELRTVIREGLRHLDTKPSGASGHEEQAGSSS